MGQASTKRILRRGHLYSERLWRKPLGGVRVMSKVPRS